MKKPWSIFFNAGKNLTAHAGIERAGYLAFLSILSIFPFIVFFVAILGVLGETDTGKEFIMSMLHNAPKSFVDAVKPQIREILSGAPRQLLTISIIGTIWTSSSMAEGLRVSLNRAYQVEKAHNYWRRRLISVLQVLALVIILIVTMFALVLVPAVMQKIYGLINSFNEVAGLMGGQPLKFSPKHSSILGLKWAVFRYFGVIIITMMFISLLYYSLPNIKHKWRKTLPGAVLTMAGWLVSAKVFTLYMTKYSQISGIYGSLGGIIGFLLFFHISAIIFIYGAEFNYLLQNRKGIRHDKQEKQ